MDRREFVVGTAAGAGALTFIAHGAGARAAGTSSSVSAQPKPLEFRQFQTWDGGSGPNRAFWSRKLSLPWANPGRGDWLDAKQAPQGGVPFAAGQINLGALKLDVTSLVSRWVSSGLNRGFYLRSGENWAFTFAGRTHSVVSARPQLRVVSSSGTTVIECSCNAMWSPSTYKSNDSRDTFMVAKESWFAALQFDTSTITGPVQSAT